MTNKKLIASVEQIESRIFLIRGQKVMLDADLAELYGVETGALNRAVKRNSERFPEDFMFQLTTDEYEALRCQNGISNLRSQNGTSNRGGRRYLPYVFTEHGALMLGKDQLDHATISMEKSLKHSSSSLKLRLTARMKVIGA